jgi:hypothetical protein
MFKHPVKTIIVPLARGLGCGFRAHSTHGTSLDRARLLHVMLR